MIQSDMRTSTGFQKTYTSAHEWVERTHDSLIAVGCEQTSDTGQYISAAGVGDIPAAEVLGYRVYEVADRYSANDPIYFKISFAVIKTSSAFNNAPLGVYRLTVGFATDGAGNIIGEKVLDNIQLYNPISANGSVQYINPQAKTLSSRGDGFLFHGGQLGLGFENYYNLHNSGFFGIIRCRDEIGEVIPKSCIVIFNSAVGGTNNLIPSARYVMVKDSVVSVISSRMHHLPRTPSHSGRIVATTADVSALGMLQTTDNFIAVRVDPLTYAWTTVELSLDGITSRGYLLIPCATYQTLPAPNLLSFNARVSELEGAEGLWGIPWYG